MENRVKTAIALGSNLGDSYQILERALRLLSETEGVWIEKVSHWYQTAPVGPPQPDYLNGCAVLEVALSPLELFQRLAGIEVECGRIRQERWGPRTLDLDILFFGQVILRSETLEIPHPRFRERAFVLIPLAEIVPHWIDPVTQKTVAELRDQVDSQGVTLIEN